MGSVSDEKQTAVSDEKHTHSDVEVPSQASLKSQKNEHSDAIDVHGKDVDKAYLFLAEHSAGDDSVDIKALRRKIDWRIVPIMFLCYVMQFVDKVMINYANVMGISTDLKLSVPKNDFSNIASAFFIAYLLAEVPTGYILQKVGVAKWLAANVFLWGVATACHAAAFNYHSLLAARIFLGIFEAAIAPCLMLLSSQWYTRSEQAPRFSFWYCGLGVGQIFGGIVSYAFQHVKNPDFQGWKAMFIAMGILTSLIGVGAYFLIPDSPMEAKWLTDAEKTALLNHVSVNQTGIENSNFKFSQLIEIFADVQIWLMVLLTVSISISSGVITTYSATLIAGFGYSRPQAALLNMPGGIVSIVSTLAVGFGVRKTSHRWAWIVACCLVGMLGGGLMSFAPKTNKAALLAGIYLVNSVVAVLIVIYQWTVANCAGGTKRTISSAIIAGAFSVGNIIGPQTFRPKDKAGGYIPAKITVMATQGGGALFALVLFLYYVWANKKKDAAAAQNTVIEEHNDWENKTDKENKTFRYVY